MVWLRETTIYGMNVLARERQATSQYKKITFSYIHRMLFQLFAMDGRSFLDVVGPGCWVHISEKSETSSENPTLFRQ